MKHKVNIPENRLCLLSSETVRTYRTDPLQVGDVVPKFCDGLFQQPHLVMAVVLDYLHCQSIGVVFVVSVVNVPFHLYLNLNLEQKNDKININSKCYRTRKHSRVLHTFDLFNIEIRSKKSIPNHTGRCGCGYCTVEWLFIFVNCMKENVFIINL